MKTLAIGSLRVYFDAAGAALFDGSSDTRAVIETTVARYRDFLDGWLEASEENRPRLVSAEEEKLREHLRGVGKHLLRRLNLSRADVEETLLKAVSINPSPRLTERRRTESVSEVMSTL